MQGERERDLGDTTLCVSRQRAVAVAVSVAGVSSSVAAVGIGVVMSGLASISVTGAGAAVQPSRVNNIATASTKELIRLRMMEPTSCRGAVLGLESGVIYSAVL